MNKVYTTLVAYNPDDNMLKKAIESLLLESTKVIICNNSNYDLLYDEYHNVEFLNFGENLGIAKAQSIAMELAIKDGADFIFQVDQDSVIESGMISSLINRYYELKNNHINVGIIGPRHFDKVTNTVDIKRLPKGLAIDGYNCEIVNETISSCSLISKHVIEECGLMEDRLFIDLVDWEYCWRIKKKGFLTIRDNDVLLGHRVGDGLQKITANVDVRIPSPIRHYYHSRNTIHMIKRNYVPFSFKYKGLFKVIAKIPLYPFVFSDGKLRAVMVMKGIYDGVLNRFGSYDDNYND